MSAETPTPQEAHHHEIFSQRLKVIWPTAVVALALLAFLLATWPRHAWQGHGGKSSGRGNRSSSSPESPVGGSGDSRNTHVTSQPHGDGSPVGDPGNVGGPREENSARRSNNHSNGSSGAGFNGDTAHRSLDDAWWAPSPTPTAKPSDADNGAGPAAGTAGAVPVGATSASANPKAGEAAKTASTTRAKPPESSDSWWHK